MRSCTRYQDIEVDCLDQNFKKQYRKYSGWVAQIIQPEIDHCNGCDNLGGGLVDTFYEPYINGEKELRQLNEEYRSNSGMVK